MCEQSEARGVAWAEEGAVLAALWRGQSPVKGKVGGGLWEWSPGHVLV